MRVDNSNAVDFMEIREARVLATPAMILYMEMTSRDLVKAHLDEGFDTVGTVVDVKHLAATPMGMQVTFHSELIEVNERRLLFRVEAYDEREKIGEGFHERAIINVQRFAAKLSAKRVE